MMEMTHSGISNEAFEVARFQAAIQDIEFTKRRQFECTYYSALVCVALFVVVEVFKDGGQINPIFGLMIVFVTLIHAVASVAFQMSLVRSLKAFRNHLYECYSVFGRQGRDPAKKYDRDRWLFGYLILFPLAAAAIVIWSAVSSAGG